MNVVRRESRTIASIIVQSVATNLLAVEIRVHSFTATARKLMISSMKVATMMIGPWSVSDSCANGGEMWSFIVRPMVPSQTKTAFSSSQVVPVLIFPEASHTPDKTYLPRPRESAISKYARL